MDSDRNGKRVLEWSDLEECAQSAFDVWVGQPELSWAREAWESLARQGLASYINELEKCRAKIRFLALAGIYHDWCYIAWDETVNPAYSSWADTLEVGAFRVGQIVGIGCPEIDNRDDCEQVFENGLRHVIAEERQQVFNALVRAHSGIDALFVSLWNSNKWNADLNEADSEEDGHDPASQKEDPYEILNSDVNEKGPAYAWLDQGADALLDSY